MMSFNSFERYQWVLTPDGKEYILVDTQTNQLVVGANRYAQLTTATNTIQLSKEDYDYIYTEEKEKEMTSKEAVETLNKYRNQNYNSTNKDEVELANAINVILPKYVKQDKLLRLYKELSNYVCEQCYAHELPEITRLKIIIKELTKNE